MYAELLIAFFPYLHPVLCYIIINTVPSLSLCACLCSIISAGSGRSFTAYVFSKITPASRLVLAKTLHVGTEAPLTESKPDASPDSPNGSTATPSYAAALSIAGRSIAQQALGEGADSGGQQQDGGETSEHGYMGSRRDGSRRGASQSAGGGGASTQPQGVTVCALEGQSWALLALHGYGSSGLWTGRSA